MKGQTQIMHDEQRRLERKVARLEGVVRRAERMGCQYPSVFVSCEEPLGSGSCISCHARVVLSVRASGTA